MAKKRSSGRSKKNLTYDPEAKNRLKKSLRDFNWKRALYLLLATIAAFAVLEAAISLEAASRLTVSVVTIVYYVIVTTLACAVVILNHGFSRKPFTRDMLSEDLPDDEAERLLSKLNRRKEIAKKIMLVLIPFTFAILLDFMYLFYGDTLKKIFGFIAS